MKTSEKSTISVNVVTLKERRQANIMTVQEQLEAVGTSQDQSMRHLQMYPTT